jgi:anaphase-promoting complex subunit 8
LFRAAELLNSLPEQEKYQDTDSQMLNADAPQSSYRVFSTTYDDPEEAALEAKEASKYLLAKSFFDTREFDRCAAVFLPHAIPAGGLAVFDRAKGKTPTSTPSKAKGERKQAESVPANSLPPLSQKSMFLSLYARYLAGEKRKDEEAEMVLGPADGGQTTNRELAALARGLESYFRARDTEDPQLQRSQGWLEYLYGVILAKSRQEIMAQQWLLRAVRLNPYHWGAWEELSALLSSVDDLNAHLTSSLLPQNIMTLFYQTHACVDLFSTTDPPTTFSSLTGLLQIFPTSTHLLTQLALSHYHAKDFEASASIFQDLLTTHPHRLDALDHYSNILYVMQDRAKLAFIAHLCTSVDKFRPETCCVVGNYYSLCSQHEKAVMYFRRALTLDRNFLSAWTLMGHEYIELKNTHAAIESYRRAVDVNRKDYRAWYGLGQAYEVLDMGFYALFYYQRAAGLRPYDPKMWQAVGSCYAKMDRGHQAIKALKRALVAGTYFETDSPQSSFNASTSISSNKKRKPPATRKLLDPETLFSIATLYEKVGDEAETMKYMDLCVAQETGSSAKSVAEAEKVLREQRKRDAKRAALAEERRKNISDPNQSMEEQEIDDEGDGDTEILSSSDAGSDPEEQGDGADGFGFGPTVTTSKARLWLARQALREGDLERSERLAEELCMDGFDVEEAKGLVREVRARREAGAED